MNKETEKWCKPEPEQAVARGSGKAASVRCTSTGCRYETSTLEANDKLCSGRQDHTRRVEWADVCGQCRTIRSWRQQWCRRGVGNHTRHVEWATVWSALGSRDRWRSCSKEANSGRARQSKARSGSDVAEESALVLVSELRSVRIWVVMSAMVGAGTVLSLPIESASSDFSPTNQTFRPPKTLIELKRIKTYLKKINKPGVKTFQSPDGDVIDCVLSHLQPAFDHPLLKGKKPLEPPERPKGHDSIDEVTESFQLWRNSSESCPEGTIPIRRTRESDVLRASSIQRFGKKLRRIVRRDTTSSDHEHAVAFVNGEQYYGAKSSMNVWAPRVTDQYEFSLSQLWIISGTFGNDLNTIEAGWQVSPELYGDNYPRFFTYWTTDAYQATGCYNLLCSGFVQTNNRIAIGAAISPRSSYTGRQFDIGMMVWKDPKHGHWWLEFGSGLLVGYWPSFLFTHLRTHATMIQFGGEIVNTRALGYHTSTQMGSGHFANEGFGKASYFRNLQVVDWDNNLLPLTNLHLLADHPNCYNIRAGRNNVWGNYFYYGGPGRNGRCP